MKFFKIIFVQLCIAALLTLTLVRAQQSITGRNYINIPLSRISGSIGGSLLVAGACNTTTVSIPGATTSMVAAVNPSGGTSVGVGVDWFAQVTSAGVVTVNECALIAATPTSTAFNVRVIP